MEQIKISVVVPTYKRPALLQKCLNQLINQSLPKKQYEIIVVSDGPDPQSRILADNCNPDAGAVIRFLSLPFKKGPAAARNLGWRNANAPLIAFTDDDCLPDPGWLQQIVLNYKEPSKVAFTGRVIVPVSAVPTDFELNTKGLETGDFVTANCVVPKELLQVVGGFDEAFAAAWREDSDLEFKLLNLNVPIVKLVDAVVVHPVRKAPWGISMNEQKKNMYNALLFKKYPLLYRQKIKSGPSWRYYFTILFFILFLTAVIFQLKWLGCIAFSTWILMTILFIIKRLAYTSKTATHLTEMMVTSFVIPFLSVYWTIYGAFKYRVLFF